MITVFDPDSLSEVAGCVCVLLWNALDSPESTIFLSMYHQPDQLRKLDRIGSLHQTLRFLAAAPKSQTGVVQGLTFGIRVDKE